MAIEWVVYTGILMAMVMCFTSAAYVAVKTVDSSVSWAGYAFTYRNFSIPGGLIGLYEIIPVMFYNLWSLSMTAAAFSAGFAMWYEMYDREVKVKTEG